MTAKALSRHEIIMNFARPPGLDDLESIARSVLATLPDELSEPCEDMALRIEEFPDDALSQDMNLESEYELLALYRSARELAPGIEKKVARGEDILHLFRRPILDLWCETCDDLNVLVRDIMIEELCRAFEVGEEDTARFLKAYQGML